MHRINWREWLFALLVAALVVATILVTGGCAVQRTVLVERIPKDVLRAGLEVDRPRQVSAVVRAIRALTAPVDRVVAAACVVSDAIAGAVGVHLGTAARRTTQLTIIVGRDAGARLPAVGSVLNRRREQRIEGEE